MKTPHWGELESSATLLKLRTHKHQAVGSRGRCRFVKGGFSESTEILKRSINQPLSNHPHQPHTTNKTIKKKEERNLKGQLGKG